MALDILHAVLIAAAIGATYDVARRALIKRVTVAMPQADKLELLDLKARVDENERAFKAICVDWRSRFNELEQQVTALPSQVETKVAGTIAAVNALPSAPKQWR